jgi:hypothetical protein
MRNVLLAILFVMLPQIAVAAEPSGGLKWGPAASSDKTLAVKGRANSNACAAYGPGFVKIDGTDTCARIGGAVRLDGRSSAGSR